MALTEQDRDWIRLMARELAFAAIKETLREHVKGCPHGQALGRIRSLLIGVALGSGIGGAGIVALISRLAGG